MNKEINGMDYWWKRAKAAEVLIKMAVTNLKEVSCSCEMGWGAHDEEIGEETECLQCEVTSDLEEHLKKLEEKA